MKKLLVTIILLLSAQNIPTQASQTQTTQKSYFWHGLAIAAVGGGLATAVWTAKLFWEIEQLGRDQKSLKPEEREHRIDQAYGNLLLADPDYHLPDHDSSVKRNASRNAIKKIDEEDTITRERIRKNGPKISQRWIWPENNPEHGVGIGIAGLSVAAWGVHALLAKK